MSDEPKVRHVLGRVHTEECARRVCWYVADRFAYAYQTVVPEFSEGEKLWHVMGTPYKDKDPDKTGDTHAAIEAIRAYVAGRKSTID